MELVAGRIVDCRHRRSETIHQKKKQKTIVLLTISEAGAPFLGGWTPSTEKKIRPSDWFSAAHQRPNQEAEIEKKKQKGKIDRPRSAL